MVRKFGFRACRVSDIDTCEVGHAGVCLLARLLSHLAMSFERVKGKSRSLSDQNRVLGESSQYNYVGTITE